MERPPRATEGEGNTAATAFKGRFSILTTGVGAMFAALAVKLWGMQMVSSDYYEKQANSNQTRTVTTPAVRGRILDRNGVALVQNRPSLAVVAYRDLAEDEVLVRHLANVLGMPYVAVLRNIQDNTEGAQSRIPSRRTSVAPRLPIFRSMPASSRASRLPSVPSASIHTARRHAISWAIPAPLPPSSSRPRIRKLLATMMLLLARLRTSRAISWGRPGVESYYENLLQGIRGEQTVKVDASGNVTGQAGAVPAKAGSDIKLTLDLKIQQACETALAERYRACQDHWLQQCRQRRCSVSRSQQWRDPGHGEPAQVRSVRLYWRRLK